jgi:CO/xanthine dehydrogenase Mo-binding subunit
MSKSAIAVGRNAPKLEAIEKVTGRAQYIADLSRPGMLHGAILQSPHAHARILRIDAAAALAVPGVHAVLTGEDFGDHRMGAFIKDETAIALGKVRYVGEPVAAVAAEDEAAARRACQLIDVEYGELPAVLTVEEALAPDAPIVHERLADYFKVFPAISKGNSLSYTEIAEGDVARAWSECEIIVEGEFETPAQAHLAMEPCGALAEIDAQGRVTLWSANQSVFRVQANVCESLGLPMARLRCVTPRVGGGFGNKMEAHVQPIVVKLTLATGRPVKLILSREEDFQMVRVRHPARVRMRTGARRDGTLVARECELHLDGGAYGDDSPGVLGYALLMSRGPYRIPHMRAHGHVVYTNKLRSGAFRGFGNPQVSFAGETQLDEIAEQLRMDPLELRLKNMLRPGEAWFGGQMVPSNGLADCVSAVRAASGWDGRSTLPACPQGKRRGFGIALAGHISGLLATGAIVRLLEDGSVVLNTGAVDIGQGSDTVLTQICAEALQIPIEQVSLASPDTDGSPYNWGTTASRVTYTTGRSVLGAAREVERQMKEHAAEILECSPVDLELRPGGRVGVVGVPGMELPFLAVSARAHWRKGGPIVGSSSLVYETPTLDPKRATALGLPFQQIGVYSFCALVVEVEIDEATGQTQLRRAWSAVDVGKAINPQLVEGQIEGGLVQGLGFALVEEVVWDGARLANPSLMDYKAPGILDVPYELTSLIVEHPQPEGPFGAKGVGEIGLVPVAPAIANAIWAGTGVRLRRLPMTAERVLRACLAEEADHAH